MKLLNEIQQELKAPKNLTNAFGGYKYRSAEGILDAVKPLLGTGTLICSDDLIMLGNRFYVKATATLSDGKEFVSVTSFARESETKKGMDESQITGSASSYARKYALNGLFAIDDIKDADSHDNREEPIKQAPKQAASPTIGMNKPATKDQIRQIEDLLANSSINEVERKRANDLLAKGLTSIDYTKMLDYLTKNQL